MTTIPLDVQLKRARLARDYFLQWPRDRMAPNLNAISDGSKAQLAAFARARDLGELVTCGAVACLGGVLATMPEVREQYGSRVPVLKSIIAVNRFMFNNASIGLMCQRTCWETGTDWEVALKRLDSLIAHLESGQDASTWRNAPKGPAS